MTSFLSGLLTILLIFVGLFLMFIVLLQRGRGGGLTGALGGLGGQSAFGTKAGDMFTRITVVVAIIWVGLNCASIFANRAYMNERDYANRKGATEETEIAPAAGTTPEGTTPEETEGTEGTPEPATGTPATTEPGSTAPTPAPAKPTPTKPTPAKPAPATPAPAATGTPPATPAEAPAEAPATPAPAAAP